MIWYDMIWYKMIEYDRIWSEYGIMWLRCAGRCAFVHTLYRPLCVFSRPLLAHLITTALCFSPVYRLHDPVNCTYVYVCVYVCVCVHVCRLYAGAMATWTAYVCTSICMYIYMSLHLYVCTTMCMYIYHMWSDLRPNSIFFFFFLFFFYFLMYVHLPHAIRPAEGYGFFQL